MQTCYQILSILCFTSISYWVLNSCEVPPYYYLYLAFLKSTWVFIFLSPRHFRNVLLNWWYALWLRKHNISISVYRPGNTGWGSVTCHLSENLGFIRRLSDFRGCVLNNIFILPSYPSWKSSYNNLVSGNSESWVWKGNQMMKDFKF